VYTVKIRECVSLVSNVEDETFQKEAQADNVPGEKIIRNVQSNKCITGVQDGWELDMNFCEVGNRSQIFSHIGYKSKKDTYSLKNIFFTRGILEVTCGDKGVTTLRLYEERNVNYQMLLLEETKEKGVYRIKPTHVKDHCLAGSFGGLEGLYQVPCEENNTSQLWNFMDPTIKIDQSWMSLKPLVWKGECLAIKNESNGDSIPVKKPCKAEDVYNREFAWSFKKAKLEAQSNSYGFNMAIDQGLLMNYKLEYLMVYGSWSRYIPFRWYGISSK
jgi:hypothetical protein